MAYNKEILLNKVIQEYLKQKEPIGSETLKSAMQIKVSSATIRNYFKILMNEGILIQHHISGGRIPTNFAMKNYWRSKLDLQNLCFEIQDINLLKKACNQNQIFALIRKKNKQKFQELINYQNQYLLLIFENGEIIIPYQQNLERFLNELIGLESQEIKNIAHQVMANELFTKIASLQNEEIIYFGLETLDFLIKNPSFHHLFFDGLAGKILDRLSNGVYFEPLMPEGFMSIIQNITHQAQEAKMLCMGSLMCDYEKFYGQIVA